MAGGARPIAGLKALNSALNIEWSQFSERPSFALRRARSALERAQLNEKALFMAGRDY